MSITYCSHIECIHKDCNRHQISAPVGIDISIADLNDGLCLDTKEVFNEHLHTRTNLLQAICRGTQNTNYACDSVCRAMCGNNGDCYYCAAIADTIEEEFKVG